jgi:hypothetical protein
MATKRTYIGVDEELVVKGRLTIEGNVTQVESTQEVNRVESNVFVINSDGTAGTTTLALKSGSDFANLTFAGTNLISSKTLQGSLFVPNSGTIVLDGGASLSGNVYTGLANQANSLVADRTLTLTGDVSGSVALGLNANTTLTPSLNVTIQPNSVALGTDTTGPYARTIVAGTGMDITSAASQDGTNYTVSIDNTGVSAASYGANASTVSNFTVNAQGQLTAAANQPISITSDQITNITVTDAGGDGSLTYSSATGVFTYTGPSQAEANARIAAAPTQVRAHLSHVDAGGDGAFSYNNTTGVFTYTGPSAAQVRAHFSASNGVDYNSSTGAFEAVEGEIQHDSLSGFVANEHIDHTAVSVTAGTGLTGGGTIASTRTLNVIGGDGITANANDIEVDNTVIRTTGNQSMAGTKTFTGSLVVPTLTAPSNPSGNAYVSGDSGGSTKAASTAYVEAAIDALVGSAPGTLDTLNELSAALNDDADIGANVVSNTTRISTLEGVTLTAGTGLSGGGTLASDRTFTTNDSEIVHDNLSGFVANEHIDHSGVTLTAGAGLTGGGDITTSRTFNVVGGTGITVNANSIETNDSEIDIHALSGYVANEHIDHTSVTLTAGDGLSGGGDITTSRSFAVDSSVVRTTGTQTISGDKTFTSQLSIPATAGTANNSIFVDGTEVKANLSGTLYTLTPTGFSGTIENVDVGSTGVDVLAGSETQGNGTIQYFIRSIDGGTYTNATESGNVITIDGDITAIRNAFSVTDAGGDGSLSYSNGVFTYTGPSASEVRSHISGTGLINFSGGVISTTADNYSSWSIDTDTGSPETISSGEKLTITGGTGVDVTHTGNTITIAQDVPVGDITGVTAGTGLSGGGTSGTVTLALDFSELTDMTGTMDSTDEFIILDSGTGEKRKAANEIGLSIFNNDSGFTTNVGDITGVTAGVGLTGGGASGAVSLSVGSGFGISTTATTVEVANADIRGLFTGSSGVNYDNSTGGITADQTEIRGMFSAGGDLAYNSSTGEFSFTNDAGDISAVVAGTGLSGGGSSGSVTLNVSGLTVSELSVGMLQTSGESFSNDDTSIMTSAAIEDKILSYGYTTNVGDITAVTAGNGLTGGATSGGATLTVGAGDYITVNANDIDVQATTTNTANKIVARDSSGNVAATYFNGTATSAHYADLAEKYEADADYEPGTVLVIGGESEVTISDEAGSYKVVGVVSTDPAYLMNSESNGVAVALRGRVPCKVTGNVNKGDVLVASDIPGHAMVGAMAHTLSPLQIIGRALESKTDAQPGVIEIIV